MGHKKSKQETRIAINKIRRLPSLRFRLLGSSDIKRMSRQELIEYLKSTKDLNKFEWHESGIIRLYKRILARESRHQGKRAVKYWEKYEADYERESPVRKSMWWVMS